MDSILTIVVPIYNDELYLEQCIESILSQSFKAFNLILIDDFSSDRSPMICDNYAEKDDRVIVIHNEKNFGLSFCRELGMKIGKTEWISFVDHDDIINPYMYEYFFQYADEEQVDIIVGNQIDDFIENISKLDWNKRKHNSCSVYEGKYVCSFSGDVDKMKEYGIPYPVWGKMYRKSLFERIYYEDYREKCPTIFFEDSFLTPRLFYNAKKVIVVDDVVYFHRKVSTSLARNIKYSSYTLESIYLGRVNLEFFENNNYNSSYSKMLGLYLLALIKSWYILRHNNIEKEKKDFYLAIDENFSRYLKKYLEKGQSSLAVKCNILLFAFNKEIWNLLFGNLWFKVMPYLKIREKLDLLKR